MLLLFHNILREQTKVKVILDLDWCVASREWIVCGDS